MLCGRKVKRGARAAYKREGSVHKTVKKTYESFRAACALRTRARSMAGGGGGGDGKRRAGGWTGEDRTMDGEWDEGRRKAGRKAAVAEDESRKTSLKRGGWDLPTGWARER